MTIDTINDVVNEFVKRLQLPECNYSFGISNSENIVELLIMLDENLKVSLSIGNGTIRVIYNDEYSADNYMVLKFLTPITLLYYLCIFFYKVVYSYSDLTFNDVLSVVFLNDIYNWKTLVQGLAENLGMDFIEDEHYVAVNDVEIRYNSFTNTIKIDTQEISLQDTCYTTLVEAMFKCVEYIANIMEVADNLFNVEQEESNVIEEEGEDAEGEETNIDIDVNAPSSEGGEIETAEPVETVENETFEEPQGPVVTMDEVL